MNELNIKQLSLDEIKFLIRFRTFYRKKDSTSLYYRHKHGIFKIDLKDRLQKKTKALNALLRSLKEKELIVVSSNAKNLGMTELGQEYGRSLFDTHRDIIKFYESV